MVTPSASLYHTPNEFGSADNRSTKPGATTRPAASIRSDPSSRSGLIERIVVPSIPTSATASNPEAGSITRPLGDHQVVAVAGRRFGFGPGHGRRNPGSQPVHEPVDAGPIAVGSAAALPDRVPSLP